ncbi:FecR domain-containing protein [Sphingosinicellaceae bacterium]|nr:FecR domain-containing protein [Sphingosinicellaceae bacterium]
MLAVAIPALADVGTVKRVVGTASVSRDKVLIPAQPGTRLEAGDVLVTGKDGRIAVTFVDDSRFSVGPNSRVAVSKFEFDSTTHKGSFVTHVERGTLAIVSGQIAHENPKGMTVQTPTSILGVRGTRFVVTVK